MVLPALAAVASSLVAIFKTLWIGAIVMFIFRLYKGKPDAEDVKKHSDLAAASSSSSAHAALPVSVPSFAPAAIEQPSTSAAATAEPSCCRGSAPTACACTDAVEPPIAAPAPLQQPAPSEESPACCRGEDEAACACAAAASAAAPAPAQAAGTTASPASGPAASAPKTTAGTILWGSQSGGCRKLAEALARRATAAGVQLAVCDLAGYEVESLYQEALVFVVISTYQGGTPPANAAWFCRCARHDAEQLFS